MLKKILKKIFYEFIAKRFGFNKQKQYYKPKKKKGLSYKFKKFFD